MNRIYRMIEEFFVLSKRLAGWHGRALFVRAIW